MEVSILEAANTPPRATLSISCGSARREAALEVGQRLLLPIDGSADNAQIDVNLYENLGMAVMQPIAATLECFVVPVTTGGAGGSSTQVKLRAKPREAAASGVLPGKTPPGGSGEGDPWKYLGEHELQTTVHSLLREVLRERPSNPFQYMAGVLRTRKKGAEEAFGQDYNTDIVPASLMEARNSFSEVRTDVNALQAFACDVIATTAVASTRSEAKAACGAVRTTLYRTLTNPLDLGQVQLDAAKISKIHSAIRWNKSQEDLEALVADVGTTWVAALLAEDPKNGNHCLHIAAQNGHCSLVKFLLDKQADVNSQNGRGQTPLHMSVEYDFYFQSRVLLSFGADPKKLNTDGHLAETGLDGNKTGQQAWDNPLNILKAAGNDKEQLDFALATLEKADSAVLDKGGLVQIGMMKNRLCKENWDAPRFQAIIKSF